MTFREKRALDAGRGRIDAFSKYRDSSQGTNELLDSVKEPPDKVVVGVVPLLKEHGVKKVLDAGCGYGRNSIFLAKEGFHVTALDNSSKALKVVESRVKEEKLGNVRILKGDVRKVEVPEVFDAVVIDSVFGLNEKKKMQETVNTVEGILKSGGIIVVKGFFSKKEIEEVFKNFRLISGKKEDIPITDRYGPDRETGSWVLVGEKKEPAPKLPERMQP